MPHLVELDLTPADFRLNPGAESDREPHWLLRHPYGRELLVLKLRRVRPELEFHPYRIGPDLLPFLESMVNLLELRDWPKPVTVRERLRAAALLLRTVFALEMGRELPDWR